nr:SIR2 family protein [Fundidesulfovibrio agrisoli]
MRCYTTNYDNSIEIAGQAIGKRYETAFVGIPPSEYSKKDLVVHINGSISELTEKTLETTFKLTDSSYNSPEGFLRSPWFHNFKNDVGRCSAIIFIGYSLYDIDIKRIVANCDGLDAYFITRKDIPQKEEYTFSCYGEVIKCEVAGFGELVSCIKASTEDGSLTALAECAYLQTNVQVRDIDLERLFIFGKINDDLVESSVVGSEKWNYLFRRTCLSDVENNISRNNVVITSDLGNGKTAFLKELAPYLLSKSHSVYMIDDQYGDIIADVDILVRRGKHFILLIDDYYRDQNLMRYLAENFSVHDLTVVATSRTTSHHKEIANLKNWGFQYVQYSLDCLDEFEMDGVISLADSMGHWGELAGMPPREKKNWIKYKNDSSLAYFLLSLFDSEDIKNRIENNLRSIITTRGVKDVIFAIAILKVANIPATASMISEVSGNDFIYKSTLRNDYNFQSLFSFDKRGAIITSSVFAAYLLKSQFSSNEIKDRFLNIAEEFNAKSSYSRDHELLFKHVLKFSSLERILKDKAKITTMASYYEDLKRRVSWLKNDPHYWLQYGMAHLVYANFDKAKTLFATAYSLAEAKSGYHTDQIDTQQARLLLKEYILSANSNDDFDRFENAHRLLVGLEDDRYKFKQIDLYRNVIEVHYANLSKPKKAKMRHFCSAILKSSPVASSFSYLEQDFIDRVMVRLREVFDQHIIKGNQT